MTPTPPRFESIEIPDRPSVSSSGRPAGPRGKPARLLLLGGIGAGAVLVLALVILLLSGRGEKAARAPADAPLIKAEEQPIKVTPENPGGMDVPNRDIMVYGRIHGAPGSKPPVERLLPEPEQPMTPPPAKPAEPPAAAVPQEAVPPPPLRDEPVPSAEPADVSPTAPAPAVPPAALPKPASPVQKPPAAAAVVPSKTPAPSPAKPAAATSAQAPTVAPKAPAVATRPPVSAGGRYQVQLYAGRSPEDATAAWNKLRAKNSDVLGSLAPAYVRADLGDRGVFYRLRAGPIESEAKATALCRTLTGRGTPCILIRSGS